MLPPGIATGGGGFTGSSTARSGDTGAVMFGPIGGLTFGDRGIDSRWLIGGAVLVALFAAAVLRKRRG